MRSGQRWPKDEMLKCEVIFGRLLREDNMNAKELFRKAQSLFIEGRHKESIDAFTESITAGGKSEMLLLSRGVAYLKIEELQKAIEDFSRVINLNGRNLRAHFYRGIAYLVKKNLREAISDLDKTIELKPDHGAAFFARGTAYARTGNEYEATRNIKTAITFFRADAVAFPDSSGLFGMQLERGMAILAGRGNTVSFKLSDEEVETVKEWLEERHH